MQKITSRTKIYILIFSIVIIGIFYFYNTQKQNALIKCPENYAETDAGIAEYRNALIDWTTLYFEANPKATSSSWSIAKTQFWIDNNCTIAIERSKLSGKVSDLKKWELVDYEVQNALSNSVDDLDIPRLMEAIKKVESEEPPRISENPTEEEVYNSDYIKHIRVALNGYLKDPKSEVDASLSETLEGGNKCGLDSFDKSYYKSKFIVVGARDNDYGGVQADLFFIDKPDKLFWVWVYKTTEEYQLRAFCESDSMFENKTQFEDFTKGMIKNSKYSL